jgi:hypothetical protein
VATCQGNQSAGIDGAGAVPPNFNQAITTTLNVNTLTTGIAPASGVDGIHFVRLGIGQDIIINSDTTPFSMFVTGAGADGIDAETPGTITITHTATSPQTTAAASLQTAPAVWISTSTAISTQARSVLPPIIPAEAR